MDKAFSDGGSRARFRVLYDPLEYGWNKQSGQASEVWQRLEEGRLGEDKGRHRPCGPHLPGAVPQMHAPHLRPAKMKHCQERVV